MAVVVEPSLPSEEFAISDQAVTGRLRRAVDTLLRNTLLVTADVE